MKGYSTQGNLWRNNPQGERAGKTVPPKDLIVVSDFLFYDKLADCLQGHSHCLGLGFLLYNDEAAIKTARPLLLRWYRRHA